MSTSRSIDRLTYTYYTGQYLSELQGPNCHKCMNELFHENKLLDVQTVFITTPKGVVQFPTRSLVFNYGREAPFTMNSFAEDFLVQGCTQCALKAMLLQVSEAAKDDGEDITNDNERKRKIKEECAIDADSDTSSTSSMAKKLKTESEEADRPLINSAALASNTIKLEVGEGLIDCGHQIDETAKSCIEDSCDKDHGLPFQYGRNPADVEDPMSINDRRFIKNFSKSTNRAAKLSVTNGLVTVYFGKQDIFTCKYCNSTFQSRDCYNLIMHLMSNDHFSKVSATGLVFSHSRDLQRLEELSNEAFKDNFTARIPFVSEWRSNKSKMCFETLFNKVACLNRSGLMDDGFSRYMFLKYPNMKYINSCDICETTVSCEQNPDDYSKHFLSIRHIAKAKENKWNMDRDYTKIAGLLLNYLLATGRKEKASNLAKQLKVAEKKKIYSKNWEEYKHLFEMDIIK